VKVYLAAQAADLHVDDVGLRIEVAVPDGLEQHGARDHLPLVAHQVGEQAQFARLQHDRGTTPRDAEGSEIYREVCDLQVCAAAHLACTAQ
jgi:hypothetical protein